MSAKVNVKDIIKGHFKTLVDARTSKISRVDLFTFCLLPIFFGVVSLLLGFDLNKEIVSLLVNFGAIFTALLLSVLVLVYDQENKIDNCGNDILKKQKKELLRQLYYNICYSVLTSLLLVALSFLHQLSEGLCLPCNQTKYQIIEICLGKLLITPFIVALVTNIFLTITMILKRMHALLL